MRFVFYCCVVASVQYIHVGAVCHMLAIIYDMKLAVILLLSALFLSYLDGFSSSLDVEE